MTGAHFQLDPQRATALATRLRLGPAPTVDDVVAAVWRTVPLGNSAKLAALASGDIPPAADIAAITDAILDGSDLSWSCLVAATLTAGLANAVCAGPTVDVTVGYRCDDDAVPVDFHTAITAPADSGTWFCDPYHGVPPVIAGDTPVTATGPGVTATVAVDPAGDWHLEVVTENLAGRPVTLRYRGFAPAADRGLIERLARVSVEFSGVPATRRNAKLTVGETCWRLAESTTGDVALAAVPSNAPPVPQASWETGLEALRSATT